ncbi:MAG: OmpA family protein, partial [Yoonia sp.]|uniref:OmpA family protein n=1 Tax=Yoonia sp. TaxID=2212373 RepID=UPI003EFA984F
AEEAAEETPAEEIAEEAPAEEAVEDAPAEEMTQEAPAEEISEETPAEESPSATPAEDAPADEMVDVEEAQTEVTDPEALADETPTAPEDTVEEAAPSAAASEDGQAGEIEEETVSDEDVRSSSQDFDNSVTAAPAATSDDDDGLSNFERALLLGLGAVAIGSILDNGDEVVSNSGDRIVLQQPDGTFRVLKDDDVLLRQPGSNVRVERFDDGSSRTFVTQADGNEIVTIRSAEGRVLRRALILPDGSQVELFDDTQTETSVDVSQLPPVAPERQDTSMGATEEELRAALQAGLNADLDRTFSLRQVRVIKEVRELAPLVELDTITFQTGSAAIQPDQARDLARLGTAIKDIVTERPGEVFLIEGHTDAVGSASSNLALSDRRAETVALALTEYFDVPAANLVTQGYGETVLKIRTLDSEVANRRASVRNITQLLR